MKYPFGLMGNPVAHSLSPLVHQQFAEQTKKPHAYRTLLVAADSFIPAVRDFQQRGGKGLNVTSPFKEEAAALVDELSPTAKQMGSVNTIVFKSDGTLVGENTDGIGLMRDLVSHHQVDFANKSVLLLGAGGAARSTLVSLLNKQPKKIVVVNRTLARAENLVKEFASLGKAEYSSYSELITPYDIVINATSASVHGEALDIPKLVLHVDTFCYDLAFQAQTSFLQWAESGTKHQANGIGMLVEQAAESFRLWHGDKPDTLPVIEMFRKQQEMQ